MLKKEGSMIEKLTKKQESKIPVYLDKWLSAGRRTKTISRPKAKKAINFYYDLMELEQPKNIVFLDSPMAVQLACNLIKNTKFDAKPSSQLGSQLYLQLRSQLGSQLYLQLDSHLDSQLGSRLGSAEIVYFGNTHDNMYWTGYYGFYDFVLNEIFPKKKKDFKLFLEFLDHHKEIHYSIAFNDIVFISDFPKEINVNNLGQLHSYNGPALLYHDGYSLYRSNGIKVTKEWCETKPEKFTKEMIINETNADIRRESIRKIGNDRLVSLLDYKVIDKKHGYELISFDLGDKRDRPYLKMVNPSIGTTHIEGVKPEIKTVEDAICFRNGLNKFELPKELT